MKYLIFLLFLVSVNSKAGISSKAKSFVSCAKLLVQISSASGSSTDSYFTLLRSLINEKNAFSSEDIRILLAQPKAVNPFDVTSPSLSYESVFAYRMAFEKILKLNDKVPIDWQKLKANLKDLSGVKEIVDVQRSEARAQTTDIPFPIFRYNISGAAQHLWPSDIIYRQGRPFILGRLKSKVVLLDLQTQKLMRMTAKSGGGGTLNAGGYFEYKGQEYLWHPEFYRIVYDFSTTNNATRKFSILPRPKNYGVESGAIVSSPDSLRSVTLFQRFGNALMKLVINDITNRNAKPKVIAEFQGYGMGDFGVNSVGGHRILSYLHRDENVVFFYDLDSGRAFPKISADLMGVADEANYAEVYEDRGELRAIFPTTEKYVIADIGTGKIIKETTADTGDHGRIRATNVAGKLIAYAKGDDLIKVIDLQTNTHIDVPAKDILSEVIEFDFNGDKYLAWGSHHGDIGVFNLSQNTPAASRKIFSSRIERLIPFSQEGRVYALVVQKVGSPSISSPAVIQLAGPAK